MTAETFWPILTGPEIDKYIDEALREDIGLGGDLTTNAIFAPEIKGQALITSRESGILAGCLLAEKTFQRLDPHIDIKWHKQDGAPIQPGTTIMTAYGKTRALLTAERVALNYMGHLSGIASLTAQFCQQIKGSKAKIADTRKTTPLLRGLEKYAVKIGGGVNHRFRLDDGILIKDNHIAMAGSLEKAIEKVKQSCGHMVKIEVEVDTLQQLERLLTYSVDAVLLDNMSLDQLRQAVEMIDGKIITEASGGVCLKTVREIAQSGVDIISVGALTHSANILDLGLDIDISGA